MRTVDIHEAKTNLSRLVDAAARGETIVIAKAGKPLVKMTAIDAPVRLCPRLGFYKGPFSAPNDFVTLDAEEIADLFDGRDGR